MDGAEFVGHWNALRLELGKTFMSPSSGTEVAARIAALGLNAEQSAQMKSILDAVLRDTMYTLLLGLDGAGSLGQCQQEFTVLDEDGHAIDSIESEAWQCFHGGTGA
ncbi:hypothetical protein [Janthinobacterium sp. RB2R34]|uniref:hypothetical protein n=1 Tax=Janthinobacterium sp. RB2R34 TaxID=3424193 RepID=UPI003F2963D7